MVKPGISLASNITRKPGAAGTARNCQQPRTLSGESDGSLFSALPLMLKGDPVITIAPLSWKNSQGESALNLSLFLKDPATTKEAPQTLAQEVDRSVKSLDAKLTIPVDMATEFMTQVAKLEGYQEDQAKKTGETAS
ncbi:DUF945 family protein [Escherichia coli]